MDSLSRHARLSALSILSAAALLPGCLDLEALDDTSAVDEEVIGGYSASPQATASVASSGCVPAHDAQPGRLRTSTRRDRAVRASKVKSRPS